MVLVFQSASPAPIVRRALTKKDAIDIWIARWLRVRRKDLIQRYGCDPRRLYEIWEGTRFPDSRKEALSEFKSRFPKFVDRIDSSHHRRLALRSVHPDQLALFDSAEG